MSVDLNERLKTIACWMFKEYFNSDYVLTKDDSMLTYLSALMEVAAADGILSDPERQWIIGYASTGGASQAVLDQLHNYKPKGMNDLLKYYHVESGHVHAKHGLKSLLYDGFRAAGADDELHPKEVEAIYDLGKALGVEVEQTKQLYELYKEETQFRLKRLKILLPTGANNAFSEIEKEY